MECWKNGTPITIEGNVEALAEIPLRREKNGMLECWNDGMVNVQ